MNPIVSAIRRPVTTLMLVVAMAIGGVLALNKMRVDHFPPLNTPKIYAYLDYIGTRAKQLKGYIVGQFESYFHKHEEQPHHEQRKIVVTSPKAKDVVITQQYVCQIRSQRHIDVRAFAKGYLEKILVKEGQAVKEGDLMFQIVPVLYQARLDAELAEARLAKLEYEFTEQLVLKKAVSERQALLFAAKRDRAKANADKAQAELNFASVKAPFDGIIDRLHQQHGSLVNEGDILTTLSDNSRMWVYFNVPEARYLEYMAGLKQGCDLRLMSSVKDVNDIPKEGKDLIIVAAVENVLHFRMFDGDGKVVVDTDEKGLTEQARQFEDLRKQLVGLWPPHELTGTEKDRFITAVTSFVGHTLKQDKEDHKIELVLANGDKFPQVGKIGAIEAQFNNETGNIPFRADFPNPDRLLRHGQTGNILIHRTLKNAIVIPQRATYEILDKRYVYVVGEDDVVHQRAIVVKHEMDDIFVIETGLDVNDRIVLEGARQVHEGEPVEFEFRKPEEALANQKYHAE